MGSQSLWQCTVLSWHRCCSGSTIVDMSTRLVPNTPRNSVCLRVSFAIRWKWACEDNHLFKRQCYVIGQRNRILTTATRRQQSQTRRHNKVNKKADGAEVKDKLLWEWFSGWGQHGPVFALLFITKAMWTVIAPLTSVIGSNREPLKLLLTLEWLT